MIKNPLERNCWDGEGSESMPPPPPQNAASSAAAFSAAPQYEYDILSSSKRTIFAMFLIFTLTKSGTLWQLGETPTRLMRKCPSSSPRGFYFRIMHVNLSIISSPKIGDMLWTWRFRYSFDPSP